MIQVFLRIMIWVAVFGVGYLFFGPQLFDSSGEVDPFASDRALFLPPVKDQRQTELEKLMEERKLSVDEAREYQALVRERRSSFWSGRETTVEETLAGVKERRKEHLVEKLMERGMSGDELAVFLTVVERDYAALLMDRE